MTTKERIEQMHAECEAMSDADKLKCAEECLTEMAECSEVLRKQRDLLRDVLDANRQDAAKMAQWNNIASLHGVAKHMAKRARIALAMCKECRDAE